MVLRPASLANIQFSLNEYIPYIHTRITYYLPPFHLTWVITGLFFMLFTLLLTVFVVFHPFLNTFPERVSPPWLLGPAMPCVGAVETGLNHLCRHGAAPASPHRGALQPSCKHMGMDTQEIFKAWCASLNELFPLLNH